MITVVGEPIRKFITLIVENQNAPSVYKIPVGQYFEISFTSFDDDIEFKKLMEPSVTKLVYVAYKQIGPNRFVYKFEGAEK